VENCIPFLNRDVSPRVVRLKEKVRRSPLRVSLERSLLYIESYKNTAGDPVILRRAKALRHVLENMSIRIDPDEIIVGGRTPFPRMGVPATEGDVEWLMDELDTISSRDQEPFAITEEEKKTYREVIYPFFRHNSLKRFIDDRLEKGVKEKCDNHIFTLNQLDHSQGHIVPDVEKFLLCGIGGLIREVREAKNDSPDKDKTVFFDSALIALEAAETFILRYANLADSMGLTGLADVCRRVSSAPPLTFREAVQSTWFLILMLIIESIGNAFSPGRLDCILYPHFVRDLKNGICDEEAIIDIIEAFYIKLNEVVAIRPTLQARYFSGFPMGFNILLGGRDERGNDTTNDLSYLFLKAEVDLGLPQPNLSVRIHSTSPRRFLRAIGYTIKRGNGMPQVFNDEAIVPALVNRGFMRNDAMNYAVIGCVELCIPGKFLGLSNAAMMNMAKLLEISMREKVHKSYDELETTLEYNLKRSVRLMAEGCNIVDRAHAEVLPTPLLSSMISNCIEKGMDVSAGGACYNFTGPQAVGIANIADCLYSLNRLVFTDKTIGYRGLIEILDADYEGHEDLRSWILNKVPKYGNGIEEVDTFAQKWSALYNSEIEKYSNPRGGGFQPGLYTVSAHVPLGKVVGATPDGRRRGEPLADGGLSPMRGRDRNGPLAVIQSASRADQARATNGTLLNLKLHPSVFNGEDALERFAGLLRGITRSGIFHVQFNVVSSDTLREAQRKPDEYKDLVIRVAGYSAYFTELNESLQDDIIGRTEHGNGT
jgi:formate C-acetyltransferase